MVNLIWKSCTLQAKSSSTLSPTCEKICIVLQFLTMVMRTKGGRNKPRWLQFAIRVLRSTQKCSATVIIQLQCLKEIRFFELFIIQLQCLKEIRFFECTCQHRNTGIRSNKKFVKFCYFPAVAVASNS